MKELRVFPGTFESLARKINRLMDLGMNQWVPKSIVPKCLQPAFDAFMLQRSPFEQSDKGLIHDKGPEVMSRCVEAFAQQCYYKGLPYAIQCWTPLDEKIHALKQQVGIA